MRVIIFKALAGGYRARAVGLVTEDHGFFVEVTSITMLDSHNGAVCSHRVGHVDIIKTISPDYLEGDTKSKVLKDFPEVLI